MVVCLNGDLLHAEYRRFKIRTVFGANDIAMMNELLRRRLSPKNRARWSDPDLIVIDGGIAQVRVGAKIIREYGLETPLVGIAKGHDRKQDLLVFDHENKSWRQVCEKNKAVLQLARDQAHHFAVSYHRRLRTKQFLGK